MSDVNNKRVLVRELIQYDSDFPSGSEGSLRKFISFLQEQLDSIPEDYRKDVRCGISIEEQYADDHRVFIIIDYERPEHPFEADVRKIKEEATEKRKRETEMNQLRKLKDKYPDLA